MLLRGSCFEQETVRLDSIDNGPRDPHLVVHARFGRVEVYRTEHFCFSLLVLPVHVAMYR